MNRIIGCFKEREIDEVKIAKLKEIAAIRYEKPVYNSSYWSIENIDTLALIYCINVDDIILVLGEDWFLCYRVLEDTVEFLEWVALNDPKTKFIQSVEMMNVLRGIFFQHNKKNFETSMRHNGSYPFYLKMLERGFFKEQSHTIDIDFCHGFAPECLKYLEKDYSSLENFLNTEEAKNHPEYLTYILHSLVFNVTDTFVDKCAKLTKKL